MGSLGPWAPWVLEPRKWRPKSISTELDSNSKKIGIYLSSGIDSTLVLALLRKEFPSTDIESISVKFSESVDETNASKKISEKFDTNHHILEWV